MRALTHTARRHDVDVPLLASVLTSNESHMRRSVELITSYGRRRIGLFGLSFKTGTDDLGRARSWNSPSGSAARATTCGSTTRAWRSRGSSAANRAYVDEHLPHIRELLTDDATAVLEHAELCVVGSWDEQVLAALAEGGDEQVVVDLARLPDAGERRGSPNYAGIAW